MIDDGEPEEPPIKPRISRAEQARGPKRAAALAKRLIALGPPEWAHLPLDELTVQELGHYARIKPTSRGALKRQFNRIGSVLQAADHDALEAALSGRRTEREEWVEALVRWRTRILTDPQQGMTDFLEQYPSTDRQRLRQTAQNAKRAAGTAKESKANRALLAVLKDAAAPE